ncbi:universal stress protein [Rhodococcus sp. 7Tela_A2]|uniref:universal stress protein n=1 Tax=Rhodococcus sp. 7Tela_A2 TaxID=3093744 RepID=UPI003BB49071
MSTGTPAGGIVVGIDGSDSAMYAARWAAAIARKLGEPLRLVHAHPGGPGDDDEPTRAVLDDAEAAVLDTETARQATGERIPLGELAIEKIPVGGGPPPQRVVRPVGVGADDRARAHHHQRTTVHVPQVRCRVRRQPRGLSGGVVAE